MFFSSGTSYRTWPLPRMLEVVCSQRAPCWCGLGRQCASAENNMCLQGIKHSSTLLGIFDLGGRGGKIILEFGFFQQIVTWRRWLAKTKRWERENGSGRESKGKREREGRGRKGGRENIHLYLYHLATEKEMQKPPLKSGEYSNQPGCYKLEPVSITMYINSHTSF